MHKCTCETHTHTFNWWMEMSKQARTHTFNRRSFLLHLRQTNWILILHIRNYFVIKYYRCWLPNVMRVCLWICLCWVPELRVWVCDRVREMIIPIQIYTPWLCKVWFMVVAERHSSPEGLVWIHFRPSIHFFFFRIIDFNIYFWFSSIEMN